MDKMTARMCRRVALIAMAAFPRIAVGVELLPCEDYSEDQRAVCGVVTVLEDRSRTAGRTIDLNIVVLRAAKPTREAPLFMLAGGPGQGATDLALLALGPYAEVLEVRDVVLVDQRGTGKSNRLDCLHDADINPQAAFNKLFDPERIAECRREAANHADPTLYGTRQVVADLDEVREKLGYEKVILWGGSGGTRTALVWLRNHPEKVEALVIDGVTPPNFRAPSTYARGAQQALDRVFEDCAAQASCNAAFPNLNEDFARLLRNFDAGPVQSYITREDGERTTISMHKGDFSYAIRGILYGAKGVAQLPQMIHAAAQSNDIQPFAQKLWQRSAA